MLKKILIGFIVLAVVIAGALFYLNNRNRTVSPPGQAALTSADLTISISYSRPSVRGRVIFGTQEQGALQPYGQYWRLGANESTEITFNRNVSFNGQLVKSGTYRIYAVPGPETFDIGLNRELGKWGKWEPDYALDVLHTTVSVQKMDEGVEQFTVNLEPAENGINVKFEWSDRRFIVPVTIQ